MLLFLFSVQLCPSLSKCVQMCPNVSNVCHARTSFSNPMVSNVCQSETLSEHVPTLGFSQTYK